MPRQRKVTKDLIKQIEDLSYQLSELQDQFMDHFAEGTLHVDDMRQINPKFKEFASSVGSLLHDVRTYTSTFNRL